MRRSVPAALCLALAAAFGNTIARADVLGTATVSNATHYGYFGFASTSAQNTKATIGPFTGTAHVINISGKVTKVNADAWISSIQVQPSGAGLATYQPWIQFSRFHDFTGTVNVSTKVYIPGGLNLASPLKLEMFSIDSESYVPGVDATSTLTYSFESDFAPGTASYTGRLQSGDATFARPEQFETYGSNGPGYTAPLDSGYTPYYDVQPFFVDTAGSYAMVSANEFESAGVLYGGAFDPAHPLSNALRALGQTGNVMRNTTFNGLPYADDATGGTVIDFDLLPGVQYYFVTTAMAFPGQASDGGPFIGRYSNVITGAGNVTLGLVPEPGCAALAAIGLAGAAMRHRR